MIAALRLYREFRSFRYHSLCHLKVPEAFNTQVSSVNSVDLFTQIAFDNINVIFKIALCCFDVAFKIAFCGVDVAFKIAFCGVDVAFKITLRVLISSSRSLFTLSTFWSNRFSFSATGCHYLRFR